MGSLAATDNYLQPSSLPTPAQDATALTSCDSNQSTVLCSPARKRACLGTRYTIVDSATLRETCAVDVSEPISMRTPPSVCTMAYENCYIREVPFALPAEVLFTIRPTRARGATSQLPLCCSSGLRKHLNVARELYFNLLERFGRMDARGRRFVVAHCEYAILLELRNAVRALYNADKYCITVARLALRSALPSTFYRACMDGPRRLAVFSCADENSADDASAAAAMQCDDGCALDSSQSSSSSNEQADEDTDIWSVPLSRVLAQNRLYVVWRAQTTYGSSRVRSSTLVHDV